MVSTVLLLLLWWGLLNCISISCFKKILLKCSVVDEGRSSSFNSSNLYLKLLLVAVQIVRTFWRGVLWADFSKAEQTGLAGTIEHWKDRWGHGTGRFDTRVGFYLRIDASSQIQIIIIKLIHTHCNHSYHLQSVTPTPPIFFQVFSIHT